MNKSILIIAGEHSGDILGAEIISEFKKLNKTVGTYKFYGVGGEMLRKQEVELIESIDNMMMVGLVDLLKSYKRMRTLVKNILHLTQVKKIKLAILVDYPGFNLYLANKLKEKNIRVIFIVSPQLWAWRYGRIKKIKKNVDLMLYLFPFEKEIYEKENIKSEHIGHPLVFRIEETLKKEKPLPTKYTSPKAKPIIGLFPGSRTNEIKYLLPKMLEAAQSIHLKYPHYLFLIAGLKNQMESYILAEMKNYHKLPIEYISSSSLRIMKASSILIVASGTVTLEAAYFKKPMLIIYITNWLSMIIGSAFIQIPFLGIVNILAKKMIVPELFQVEVTAKNITSLVELFIKNKSYAKKTSMELEKITNNLAQKNPAKKAANSIVNFIKKDL